MNPVSTYNPYDEFFNRVHYNAMNDVNNMDQMNDISDIKTDETNETNETNISYETTYTDMDEQTDETFNIVRSINFNECMNYEQNLNSNDFDLLAYCVSCSICLENYELTDSASFTNVCRLRCSHYYHTSCIDVWLLSHSTCPLCRVQI